MVGLRSVPLSDWLLSLGTGYAERKNVRKELCRGVIPYFDHIVAELADAHGLKKYILKD